MILVLLLLAGAAVTLAWLVPQFHCAIWGHDWKKADCVKTKICLRCEETEGKPLGHSWVEADCVNPKTCSVCGETEGEALGHTWMGANCEKPKRCSVCGETEGEPKGHNWVEDVCTKPKTCTICGKREGEAPGHERVIKDADKSVCEQSTVCSRCGKTLVNKPGHKLTDYGECTVCGERMYITINRNNVKLLFEVVCKVKNSRMKRINGRDYMAYDFVVTITPKVLGEFKDAYIVYTVWPDPSSAGVYFENTEEQTFTVYIDENGNGYGSLEIVASKSGADTVSLLYGFIPETKYRSSIYGSFQIK